MTELIEASTVAFPASGALSIETHAGLRAMERALAAVDRATAAAVRAWVEAGPQVWVRLRGRGLPLPTHRLIDHAHFDFDTGAGRARSSLEAEQAGAARRLVARCGALSDDAFVEGLADLHAGLDAPAGEAPGRRFGRLRDASAFSAADADGYAIRYPEPAAARRSVASARVPLAATSREAPAFASLAFMVVLGAAHPFADGNGRVARLMSNALLQEGTGTPLYLPFHELSYVTGGSLILCLREASYFGRWEPMARWFLDLAALTPILARELQAK